MPATRSPLSRPLFIVGSGRSGTTLVLQLLVGHPEFAWISRLTDRFPAQPYFAALSRPRFSFDTRGLRPSVEVRRTLTYCGVTTEQLRAKGAPLGADDLEDAVAEKLHAVVRGHCRSMGRSRFISKSTENAMRIELLLAAFPDARFIHVLRNGYAVCSSLMRVNWWPDLELWWLGSTPSEWEAAGKDPYHLAGLHWSRQVKAALGAREKLDETNYFEVRYEDLLENPRESVQRMLGFAGLEWSTGFDRHFSGIRVDSQNSDAWRSKLNRDQLDAVNNAASPLLEELGYGPV
jgi:hypothetical protein